MIELFDKKKHDRDSFDCGKEILNVYLKKQVNQDIKRKLSVCFVLVESTTKIIKGYYTLSNCSIPLVDFSDDIRKKLPPFYSTIPTTLIGHLAIHKDFQGQGVGKTLLIDALRKSYEASKKLGSFAVVVDPIDKEAESFYAYFDFVKLPDSGKMILSIKTLEALFE
ncbi:MAG: GNAT family N-acetyltransferase [Crocinitomicaceae bacterium]|nr:GNAT family N-acetyltransferase [Crocinitomicaceae bacterium]